MLRRISVFAASYVEALRVRRRVVVRNQLSLGTANESSSTER